MEVIVAVVVLGITAATVGRLMVTGDLIRGKASQLAIATGLAQNEAARMRVRASRYEPVTDTAYVLNRGGLELEVRRRVIPPETPPPEGELRTAEVQVEIYTLDREEPFVSFRFLQGYSR
jgi:hypothetical protein